MKKSGGNWESGKVENWKSQVAIGKVEKWKSKEGKGKVEKSGGNWKSGKVEKSGGNWVFGSEPQDSIIVPPRQHLQPHGLERKKEPRAGTKDPRPPTQYILMCTYIYVRSYSGSAFRLPFLLQYNHFGTSVGIK